MSDAPHQTSIRRSLGWMAGGQGAYFVFQFASSVVLARLLTPYEMGVFAIAFAVVGLIGVLQSIGLNNYLVRAEALSRELTAAVFSMNALLAILFSGTIALCGLLGRLLFHDGGVRDVLFWLALTPLIGAAGFLPQSLLEREGDFRAVALIKTCGALTASATTVAFAFAGFSYMSLAYGQVVGALAGLAVSVVLAPHHVDFRLGAAGWRDIGRFGLHMLLISGITRIGSRLQDIAMGKLLGFGALGLFTRAGNVFSMLWENVYIVIGRVVFVDLANATLNGTLLSERYEKMLSLITAIMWPAFAGLAVLSAPFIELVYGPKWMRAALPLSLLCINGIFLTGVAMAWELFVLANETGRQARFEFLRSLLGIVLFVGGCFISIEAAAASRVIDGIFSVLLYGPHIIRITRCKLRKILAIYVESTVLTICAITPSLVMMTSSHWSTEYISTPYVILSVGLGIACWLIALPFFEHPLFVELRRATPKGFCIGFERLERVANGARAYARRGYRAS